MKSSIRSAPSPLCPPRGVMADLQESIRLHALYLQGDPAGKRADLRGANLYLADLSVADLRGADLDVVAGNMREVKTVQVERFPVVWIQPPNEETIVQIGCQRHELSYWKSATSEVIDEHVGGCWDDWQRLWPHVLALIEVSPAVPYGTAKEVE